MIFIPVFSPVDVGHRGHVRPVRGVVAFAVGVKFVRGNVDETGDMAVVGVFQSDDLFRAGVGPK